MTVISKELFNKVAVTATCHEILHPAFKNCRSDQFNMFINSLKGCFQFFLALYVIELIIKYKKVNKVYIQKLAKNFLTSYVYGLLYTNVFYSSLCVYRYLLGRYEYHTLLSIPGFLGGLTIFYENPIMKNLNTVMYFTMTLEAIINCLNGENIINRSPLKDTLCFMVYNSFFLYLLKHNPLSKEATIYWFFNPKNEKNEENACCKNGICSKYLLQDGLKYFSGGYSFQIVRYLVRSFGNIISQPSSLVKNLFSMKALKTGLFFSSYVTIYKLICRVLYELDGEEKSSHSLLAGLFAGISYYVDPNLQFNVLPLSMVLQILWINIRSKYKIPNWYLKEIFFALCSGLLVHCYIIAPDYCPKYVDKMVHAVSNGKSRHILKNVHHFIEKRSKLMLS